MLRIRSPFPVSFTASISSDAMCNCKNVDSASPLDSMAWRWLARLWLDGVASGMMQSYETFFLCLKACNCQSIALNEKSINLMCNWLNWNSFFDANSRALAQMRLIFLHAKSRYQRFHNDGHGACVTGTPSKSMAENFMLEHNWLSHPLTTSSFDFLINPRTSL